MWELLRRAGVLVAALAASACRGGDAQVSDEEPKPATDLGVDAPALQIQTVHFRSDPPVDPGEEAFVCHVVDVPDLDRSWITALAWSPADAPVAVHHLTVGAAPPDTAVGTYPCGLYQATGVVFIFGRGAERLTLPHGVGLRLPGGTRRVHLEAHVLRSAVGQGGRTYLEFGLVREPPAEEAAWVDVSAGVPLIPAHGTAEASATCRFEADVRLLGTWPHMHRLGRSFTGTVHRASGAFDPLIEVTPWDFEHQPMHLRDVALRAGDAVTTLCKYHNDGDSPVANGPLSSDEMCNQGLWVSPSRAARCAP